MKKLAYLTAALVMTSNASFACVSECNWDHGGGTVRHFRENGKHFLRLELRDLNEEVRIIELLELEREPGRFVEGDSDRQPSGLSYRLEVDPLVVDNFRNDRLNGKWKAAMYRGNQKLPVLCATQGEPRPLTRNEVVVLESNG